MNTRRVHDYILEARNRLDLALEEMRVSEPAEPPPVDPPPSRPPPPDDPPTRPARDVSLDYGGNGTLGTITVDGRAIPPRYGWARLKSSFDDLLAWAKTQLPEDRVTPRWPNMAEKLGKAARNPWRDENGWIIAFPDDADGGGAGGIGIPPFRFNWRLNADGIVGAVHELIGVVNRHPIFMDMANVRPGSYALFRSENDVLPGYPFVLRQAKPHTSHYRAFDGSHLSRGWRCAAFLVENVDPWSAVGKFAAWWLSHFAQDLDWALGYHLTSPSQWYEVNRQSFLAPLYRRMEWLTEGPYHGWFGRHWMHQAYFWDWMEKWGERIPRHPGRTRTDDEIRDDFRITLQGIRDTHPLRGWAQSGCLQWGGGQTFDALPPEERARGKWTQGFESGGLGVPLLRDYGFTAEAASYAEWLGPHPWSIRLLDGWPGRPPSAAHRYGGGAVESGTGVFAGWYDPQRPDGERRRTPYIRWSMFPGYPGLDEAAETHFKLDDGPLDYAAEL